MSAAMPIITPETLDLAARLEASTAGTLGSWIRANREADERAARCRELCLDLWLRQELTEALVHRAASEPVVRAAARRFRDWRDAVELMRYEMLRRGRRLPTPPSYEDAAVEIVDTCMRLEREGLLEHVVEGK
jgi:hypothetical protein